MILAAATIGGALSVLWWLDALRLRGRARSLVRLAPSDEPVSPTHTFLVRPGVALDDATRRAASAHARAQGLEVLDLIPARIGSWRAMQILQTLDPATYRKDRIVAGITAGDAVLVDAAILERAQGLPARIDDAVAFAEAARILKRHAVTTSDVALADGLSSPGISLRARRRLVRLRYTDLVMPAVAIQLALLATTLMFAPWWGLAALVSSNLQVFIATAGTPIAPKDAWAYLLLRPLVDALSTFGPAAAAHTGATPDQRRAAYHELLASGVDRFFERERDDCPLCGAKALERHLSIGDRYQFKPGRFTLSRCKECGHIFQNPRLSIAGLDFYYRDFYDGLGAESMETVFSGSLVSYLERARMVADVQRPQRWLDVGAGHGHFCCIAREILPDTRFDGLDMSDSIDDAVRRRWVDAGIRGLFPEVAPDLERSGVRYDVVSMSHYLEHTLDPRAEIAAARRVLPEGGLFLIEVPDPESRLGRVFGRQWMPWFQPQHLHFVSARNLEKLLREQGFEPVIWHRGPAHQAVDFFFFAFIVVRILAGPVDLPWLRPSGVLRRLRRAVVWTVGVPWLVAGFVCDLTLGRWMRRDGWSNTYRVVARRLA